VPSFVSRIVLRAWLNFLPRPKPQKGFRSGLHGRFRNPQFVSFMAQNNRRRVDIDLHDTVLRGRKLVKNLLRFALAGGCTWIVLESAKALSIF
jgi:hypothetical protein